MLNVKRGPAYYRYYDLCENIVRALEYLIDRYKVSYHNVCLQFTFDCNSTDSFYRFKENLISIDLLRVHTHCDLVANNVYQILCHEFYHFMQHCEERLKPNGFHLEFENKLYDTHVFMLTREQYVQLPWEKEANDFMRAVTPDVLKHLGIN